jgi:predicted porin
MYGVVDIGFTHENTGAATINRLDSGNVLGSRLGFKGTEDLGGGLSANFQLENGFAADTGNLGQGGRLFGRQAWVGLAGGFGSVKFGRQYTPMWKVQVTVDPFGLGLTGTGIGGNTGAGMLSIFYGSNLYGNTRADNTVKYGYSSGPFSTEVAYAFGEVAGNNAASRQVGLNAEYSSGPAYAGLAYHKANDATGNDSIKVTLLGGMYDFGVAKLHGAYAWNKGTGTQDSTDAMIGVSAPAGTGTVLATYIRHNNKAVSNADSNQIGIGYIYPLSKRTSLYTSYSRNANDSGASLNAGGAGMTDTLINAGITHKF